MNVPNILSIFRLFVTIFFVLAVNQGRLRLALLLFILQGVSDLLDGFLARIMNKRTSLGAFLDPVADKLLLSTLFLVLMHEKLMPTTVTVLVFGRDVGILLVAAILYAAAGRREFKPSILGKANTLAQVSAVAAVLMHQLTAVGWVAALRTATLDATIALTVFSGLHYAWTASRRTGNSAGNGAGKEQIRGIVKLDDGEWRRAIARSLFDGVARINKPRRAADLLRTRLSTPT